MRLPGRLIGEVRNWRPRGSWRATEQKQKKRQREERSHQQWGETRREVLCKG